MMELSIACPLCSQPGFSDVNTLWFTLIRATTRQLACPVCHEVLCGLDKLTIHLVSHSLHDQLLQACAASNLLSAPSAFSKNTDMTSLVSVSSQDAVQAANSQSAPVASYVLINFPSVENTPAKNNSNAAINEETAVGKNLKSGSTMSCLDANLPDLVEFKAEESLSASNGTAPVMPQNVSNDGIDTLEFLDPHPPRSECSYVHISSQSQRQEKPSSEWNQGGSQYELQIPRSCSESSLSKFPSLCGSDLEPKSVTKEVLQNFPPQTPHLVVSCGICDLSFKDNNIAMLHQQLVHNLSPQNDNSFLFPSKLEERNTLKQRPKRTNVCQTRDGAGSLHRYPCHICSKVFRMRGSLMVHIRVAHSPSGTAGLASRLGSSSACSKPPLDVIGKLPMQNLSLKDPKLSFTAQEEFHKTGITDQALFGQRVSGFSNSLAVSKSGPEQLCATSNQLPLHDSRSSKSPISSVSPSSSPSQSPISQVSSSEPTGTIYPCSLCNKTYSKEILLTQHLKSHESKQWECDVCFKSFTTKYFLKKHKRLHTGEMPYTCAICNKSFTFQQSYHKHLLYHSDEKPHSCNECGRAFKELSTLHNHQRIHTGEKPWACETCGKCFRQRVSYLVHRRIHTGAMPYQCSVCLKSFRYKVSQRTHKCVVLPTTEVGTQPQSGDLLQHLLQSTPKEAQCHGSETSSIAAVSESQMPLKNQLQQMSGKQDNQNQNVNDLLHNVSARNSNDNPPQVIMHQELEHQTLVIHHQSNDREMCSASQPHEFIEFHLSDNETMTKAASISNLKPCLDVNLESASHVLQESKNVSNLSSPLSQPTPSSADFNVDMLQDILSMVMSPYSESTPSPSSQMRHLSLTGQNDDDLEAGLELRQLLYGSCDSQGTP